MQVAAACHWQVHAALYEAGSQRVGQAVDLSHLLCKRGSAGPDTCTGRQSTEVRQRQDLLS